MSKEGFEKLLKYRFKSFQKLYPEKCVTLGTKPNPAVEILLGAIDEDFNNVLSLPGNHPALKTNKLDDLQLQALLEAIADSAKQGVAENGVSKPLDYFALFSVLDVSYNEITDKGAELLAQHLVENKEIRALNLSFNSIEEAGAQALAKALHINDAVQELDLSFNNIGYAGSMAIVSMLQINTSLASLNLRACKLPADALIGLASVLRNNDTVNVLDISDNATAGHHLSQELHSNVMQHIADTIRCSTTLKRLYLAKMAITDWEMVDFLALSIASNKSIEFLDLSANKITIDGGVALFNECAKFSNSSLQELILTSNSIRNEGAFAAASWLSGNSSVLARLKLDYNNIDKEGLLALARALKAHNQTLSNLALAGNHWEPQSAEAFAELVGGASKTIAVAPAPQTAISSMNRAAQDARRDTLALAKDSVKVIDALDSKAADLIRDMDNTPKARLDPRNCDMQFAVTQNVYTAHLQKLPSSKSPNEVFSQYLKTQVTPSTQVKISN